MRTRTRGRRQLVALAAGLVVTALGLGLVGLIAPAGADEQAAPQLTVQQVSATGATTVVSGNLVGADPSTLRAKVNGKAVDAKVSAGSKVPLDVVVVLDNAAVLGNATVQLAKQALAPLLPGKGVVDRMGLVTTGGGASVEVGTSTSADQIQSALNEVGPVGQSATWDGLVQAGNLLADDSPQSQKVVILFSASANAGSSATATKAQTVLRQAGAQLDSVVMPRGADVEAIDEMIGVLGGTRVVSATEDGLAKAFTKVSEQLAGRFRLSYPSNVASGRSADLTVSSGATAAQVSYVVGADRAGAENLAPPVQESPGFLSSLLDNQFFIILVVLLGVVAIVMFVWTGLSMVLPDGNNLDQRLQVYEDPYGDAVEEGDSQDTNHTTVPIIRRAVDFTGDVAQRRGVLEKLEADLERANLPLRGAEALFFVLAGAGLLAVLVFLLTGNPLVALIAVGLAVMVPRAMLSFKVRKRRKAFEGQLPDMLTLMAGTLRAGYSIGQGFDAVSREIEDPMGRELRRVVSESRLGRPLDEALDSVAERMQSDDFGWAVMAIRIQREVGGNLAELLLTVANTMTQRERLRRDVATLTAEGRMSAIILGLLPPALGAVMFVMNPGYISKLFEPGIGYIMIGLAVIAMLVGFAWMKKIITIEV